MRRFLIILLVFLLAFCCGFFVGTRKSSRPASFHDMVVNNPQDIYALFTIKDSRVRKQAAELQSPENAYAFVRDRINNAPARSGQTAGEIIAQGEASCLGKAILLFSLYRAMGIPSADIRVVTGEVEYPGGVIDHAWVEMEHDGVCLQQDPSDLLGLFSFDQFRGNLYTRTFIRREGFTFNDKGFAVVSRLNQMRGSGHPMLR